MKIKEFDIVVIHEPEALGRKFTPCVAINITKADIKIHGTNTTKAGLHLLRGYWYGRQRLRNTPFSHNSYGKIEGHVDEITHRVFKIGRVRTAAQLRALKV